MNIVNTTLIVATLGLIKAPALSQELQENFYPIRPLGMGNAFTAISNDENSVWTNPGGVSRARKHRDRKTVYLLKIPNLGLGANTRGQNLLQNSNSSSEETLEDTIVESGDLGESKPYWIHAFAFPVMMYNFSRQSPGALGGFSKTSTKMLVSEDSPDQTSVNMVSDQGLVTNFSWTNQTNRLSGGINLRYTVRTAFEETIPTEELKDRGALQTRIKDNMNLSYGIGLDAGFMFTFADYWFPTLGVAILNLPTGCQTDYLNPATKTRQNVCGTKYQGNIVNEDALSALDPTDTRIGISITPRLAHKMALRLGLDVHHLNIPFGSQNFGLPSVELQKMLHGGLELFFGNPLMINPFSIRVGMGQNFFSAGVSVHLPYWSLDFATYGVDVSSTATPVEDRRYIAGTSLFW